MCIVLTQMVDIMNSLHFLLHFYVEFWVYSSKKKKKKPKVPRSNAAQHFIQNEIKSFSYEFKQN